MRELSRQVMALERAKLELEVRNRQLEASAQRSKDSAPSPTPSVSARSHCEKDAQIPWNRCSRKATGRGKVDIDPKTHKAA